MKDIPFGADAPLHFNKVNLVTLMLVVHHERKNGIFLNDLFTTLRSVAESNRDPTLAAPARSTWFNWLKEFDEAFPNGIEAGRASECAVKFVEEHPRWTDKYYRKFNRHTFAALQGFLFQNGYLGAHAIGQAVGGMQGSLYFAMVDFFPRISPAGDHKSLPGTYRVFRPSLSCRGKTLVSAACIISRPDGTLYYSERMHYRLSTGWCAQLLEGYVFGVEGRAFLITRDDNTELVQFSILRPLSRQRRGDHRVVQVLAGGYSGASSRCESGLFHTGIAMVRDNALGRLERFDVSRWKIGHLPGFGLVDTANVPDVVQPYMELWRT